MDILTLRQFQDETLPPPRPPYVGWRGVGLISLWQGVYALPFVLPFFIAAKRSGSPDLWKILGYSIGSVAGTLLVARRAAGKWNVPLRCVTGEISAPLGRALSVAICALGFASLQFGLIGALARRVPSLAEQFGRVKLPFDSGHPAALIAIVITAPLMEELLFRGLYLKALHARYSALRSVLLTALLFALAHGFLVKLPTTYASGLFFGWLAIRSGGIWLGAIAHAMNNLFATSLAWWITAGAPAEAVAGDAAVPWSATADQVLLVAGVVASLPALWWLRRDFLHRPIAAAAVWRPGVAAVGLTDTPPTHATSQEQVAKAVDRESIEPGATR